MIASSGNLRKNKLVQLLHSLKTHLIAESRDTLGKVLLISMALGFFFRLHNISGNVQFLGDQGRDALIVAKMFVEADPAFIGPVTSVGNLYLGPLYYYFMLPFLWMSYPSPVGPAYAVALLSCATIVMLYVLGKQMVGRAPAVIATVIFSLSQIYISYSRFSWNPNPAPFVSLILIYSVWRALRKKYIYWVLAGLCFAVLLQLHYMTLLLAAPLGTLWLEQLYREFRAKKLHLRHPLLKAALAIAVIIAFSYIPVIIFDTRHDWLNIRGIQEIFFQSQHFADEGLPVWERALEVMKETHGRGMHFLFDILIGQHRKLNSLLLIWVLAIVVLSKKHILQTKNAMHTVATFFFWSLLIISAYQHTVFNHYISFLWPITALLLGFVIHQTYVRFGKLSLLALAPLFGYFLYWNLSQTPLSYTLQTPAQMREISQQVVDAIEPDKTFSLVSYEETREYLGMKYRYFFYTLGRNPIALERSHEADYLVVILESGTYKEARDEGIYDLVVFPGNTIVKEIARQDGTNIVIISRDE